MHVEGSAQQGMMISEVLAVLEEVHCWVKHAVGGMAMADCFSLVLVLLVEDVQDCKGNVAEVPVITDFRIWVEGLVSVV